MHVCVYHERWPPDAAPDPVPGVRHVVLPWVAVADHVAPHDLDASGLRAGLDARGVQLAAVELPPLTCLDLETFDSETDETYMRLQILERVGVPLAIIASGHDGAIGLDMTIDALSRLAALAERMDVRLLVRNACGSALEQPDALHLLFHRVASPGLGFCLDALEFAQAVVNASEVVSALSDRLAAVCLPARAVPVLRVTESSIHALITELATEGFTGPAIIEAREAGHFLERFGSHFRS